MIAFCGVLQESFIRGITLETVVLLSKGEIPSKKVKVEFSLEGMDTDGFKDGATYDEIRDWVQEKYGMHVTNLNIAQIKRKNGIIERENYNKPKSEDSRQPETTPEKEKAITPGTMIGHGIINIIILKIIFLYITGQIKDSKCLLFVL